MLIVRPVRSSYCKSLRLFSTQLILACVTAVAAAQAPMTMDMPEMSAIGSVSAPAKGADDTAIYQAASTKRMADRLQQIFAASDWKLDPNKPQMRIEYYTGILSKYQLPLEQDTLIREQLAQEMLSAGDSAASIRELNEVRRRWQRAQEAMPAEAERKLGKALALSFMRLGEQQNCAVMNGQHKCLFPLRADAVHHLTEGAQGAVKELTALLKKDPSDTQSQWLLNVAYMQLGRYPADVPARWLIPESHFASDYPMPVFPQLAASAGIDITGHAGGVAVADFDGDGRLDIMISSSGPMDQIHLFHNNGDGTFSDVTRKSGLIGETGGLNLVLTDFSNDGHPDVLVLRGGWWGKQGHYPMSLLRNNGNGTFDDVTEAAGLYVAAPTQAAAWADFDGDGWLDLFVGYESTPDDRNSSLLFHNNHDGTFTQVGAASGLGDMGFVKGVAWGDYNNDGRPDLFVSTLDGKDRLFRNDGPRNSKVPAQGWRFTDVTAAAGIEPHQNSFATWFFDYDNNGWPDLFVAGYSLASTSEIGAFEMGKPVSAAHPRLYRNMHDGTFKDVTLATHLDRAILVMGASFGDLDNDGWLDIYLGTGDSTYESLLPNRMFRNDEGRRFQDVTTAGDFGHLQKGHSIAFADLRNSGFEDVLEEMGGAQVGDSFQSALYRNPGNGNHWITLQLEGVHSNRAAFGARIDVALKTGHAGTRHIYRTVGFGSSFGGNPLEQHIGLGPADRVAEITVTWPATGVVDHLRNVAVDRTYHLREGDATLHEVFVH